MTTSARLSLWSRLKSFFGAEAHAARRTKDMARSPVGDMRAILRSGGKFFATPITPFPQAESSPLPEWNAESINGNQVNLRGYCRGHVTLLTICFSAYAEPHLESFRKPFIEEYLGVAKLIDVRPLMTRIKWVIFSKLLRSSARSALPASIQPSFIIAHRPMSLLDALDVPNYLGAYVYLVDRKGRVRWMASGLASEDEVSIMRRTIKKLLAEPQ